MSVTQCGRPTKTGRIRLVFFKTLASNSVDSYGNLIFLFYCLLSKPCWTPILVDWSKLAASRIVWVNGEFTKHSAEQFSLNFGADNRSRLSPPEHLPDRDAVNSESSTVEQIFATAKETCIKFNATLSLTKALSDRESQ